MSNQFGLKHRSAFRRNEKTSLLSIVLLLTIVAFMMTLASSGSFVHQAADNKEAPKTAGIAMVGEYKIPGLEVEISGIYPHVTDPDLYYVAANKKPAYRAGQTPMLPAQYRGKLLTINSKTGQIVQAFDLVNGEYGGIAYGEGYLFVASLEPPEILKVDPKNGKIVSRLPVSGPVGGLDYDKDRSLLIAQLYIGFPHLAVIDPKTGATLETLWSDESAMDLAKVGGDWLCTWASGFDKQAFSELRLLDQKTGKVKGRLRLDAVHTSMAPLDKKVAGTEGFICMVSVDRSSGKVTVRKYAYTGSSVAWVN